MRLAVKSFCPEIISDFFVTVTSKNNQADKQVSKAGGEFQDNFKATQLGDLVGNQMLQSYCFTSRLGADIKMMELMGEPKIVFLFPKQLL